MEGWQIQLPTGEFLDLPEGYNLPLELNNLIFSGSDTGSLPGSFSFPSEVPNSPRNMALFGRPHLTAGSGSVRIIEGVWVYACGLPLFYGKLTVRGANADKIKFDLVANPLAALKEVELPDLDLGGTRSITPYTLENFMLATAQNPEAWDFAFFPVIAENLLTLSAQPAEKWLNFHNQNGAGFQPTNSGAITPFVKIEYLFKQMFAGYGEGFEWRNDFQRPEDPEMRRLYVFNNVDARKPNTPGGAPVLPGTFDLKRHVPKIKSTELLKKVCAQWNLGLFTNLFSRTLRLAPVADILKSDAAQDWTPYMASLPSVDNPVSVPRSYTYDEYETLPPGTPNLATMRRFTDLNAFYTALNAGGISEEYVYIECSNTVVNKSWYTYAIDFRGRAWGAFPPIETNGDGNAYNPGVNILPGGFDYYRWKGGFSKFEQNTEGVWEWKNEDYPLSLLFFRGIQHAYSWPVSGNSPYLYIAGAGQRAAITRNGTTLATASRSMDWVGEYGLWAKYHEPWYNVLKNGKTITQNFAIPVAKLAQFGFDMKIRVGDMEYIVKRIRVARLANGHALIEANLVAVM